MADDIEMMHLNRLREYRERIYEAAAVALWFIAVAIILMVAMGGLYAV